MIGPSDFLIDASIEARDALIRGFFPKEKQETCASAFAGHASQGISPLSY
jgi:hypothetical protein